MCSSDLPASDPALAAAGVSLHPSTAGNGYPSDERTKAWMRKFLDPVFGWPSVVRFSWKPAVELLEKNAVRVVWEEDDAAAAAGGAAQTKLSSFFSSASSAAAGGGGGGGAGAPQCAYLRKRRIEGVSPAAF